MRQIDFQLGVPIGLHPVGAMALVDAKTRAPGPTAVHGQFTSTSAYIAPSVSKSRIAVNPCRARARVARAEDGAIRSTA